MVLFFFIIFFFLAAFVPFRLCRDTDEFAGGNIGIRQFARSYVSKGLSINEDITNISEGNFDACDDGDKIKPFSG